MMKFKVVYVGKDDAHYGILSFTRKVKGTMTVDGVATEFFTEDKRSGWVKSDIELVKGAEIEYPTINGVVENITSKVDEETGEVRKSCWLKLQD